MHIFRSATVRLLAVALLCAVSIVYYSLRSRSAAVTDMEDHMIPIYSVAREDKVVAFTFDAAWGADHTLEILDELDVYHAKATFFLVGFWVQHYPDMVQEIAERGHAVGNHSENHPKMTPLSEEQMVSELATCQQRLDELIGEPECLVFRPPFGDWNEEVVEVCGEAGYYVIQWDVDSLDWKELSAQEIQARILDRVQPGSIVLMHNNGVHTAEALPGLLSALTNDGYTFVTVPELIYRDHYRIDHTGRQHPLVLPDTESPLPGSPSALPDCMIIPTEG
jgi:polysaccharide deacetylase family sporulation protein PdaB